MYIILYCFFFLYCNKELIYSCIGENYLSVKLWCLGKVDDFCNNIDRLVVIFIDNKLYDLLMFGENISWSYIINIIRELCDVFFGVVRIIFGLKYNKNFLLDNINIMNKKLWFNGECRVVRKNFYLVKCIYKKC